MFKLAILAALCITLTGNKVEENIVWKSRLGVGTSRLVSEGKSLYTLYSNTDPKTPNQGEEVVVALNITNGKPRWEYRYPVQRLPKQESYDEARIRPQGSPALLKGRLCTLGYTGLLKCFDTENGKRLWEYDLVKEFGATPVQFGFSSSPIAYKGAFVVHVGGKQSSLIAFQAETGAVLWKAQPNEPSYATPVLFRVGEEEQIVQMTRDAIFGFSAQDGRTRWVYTLPKVGLTNVPTPIALPKGRLLISGQGVLGTRLLQVEPSAEQCRVTEVWHNRRTTFFYCNWVTDSRSVFGCIEDYLYGLDIETGKELFRERGQTNGNIIALKEQEAVVIRRDGLLTRCQLSSAGIKAKGSLQALSGMCWTPPLQVGETIFIRDDEAVVAIKLSALAK